MLAFLLSHQRSGSHLLKSALELGVRSSMHEGRPALVAPPEILTPNRSQYDEWQEWFLETHLDRRLKEQGSRSVAALEEAVRSYISVLQGLAGGRIALCDVKINQLHVGTGWYHEIGTPPPFFFQMLSAGKVVVLRRRNLLRAVVSGMVAAATGEWHRPVGAVKPTQPIPRPRLTVDPDNLLYWMRHISLSLENVDRWLSPYATDAVCRVDYEDLIDPESQECKARTFDRVAAFLGCPTGVGWTATYSRTGDYRLCEVIENFDAVRRAVDKSEFAHLLEECPGSGSATDVKDSNIARRLAARFFGLGMDKRK